MELTEKEIEAEIERERLYLLGTEGFVAMPKLVARAAHAIHERLRKGVVWEEEYETSFDGITRLYMSGASGKRCWAGELDTIERIVADGEAVQVAVKKT